MIDSTKAQFQAVLDPQMLWDLCTVKIAQKAKDYCVQRKKLSKTLEQLEKELSDLHEKLATTKDAETLNSYNKLQMEVDIKICEKADGAKVRSKVKWIEQGERNANYFLNQEKKDHVIK